jgi:predicted phage terminase large subunit-like protein
MANSKSAIREELKNRLLAERDFRAFCRFQDRKYPADAEHIKLMTANLQEVAKFITSNGKEGIGRLMIFMPPRYWKSQTASRKFPAWLLGQNPDLRIILTSYGADLASKHSREVRDIIESEEYSQVFGALASANEPVTLDPDSRSAAQWDLKGHNGGMIAAGVGGAITGFGANLFIIDDPFKSRDEASSKARRDLVWEWYRSTAYTRLEDHGAVILVMTRWDQDDVAGELLRASVSDPEADQWHVLSLRAEALEENAYPVNEEQFIENLLRGIYVPMGGDPLSRKAGDALWPEKHTTAQLKALRANISDFEFEAQYNQMPRLAVGEFLDDSDFLIQEKAPENLQWYRYVDLALGESQTSDFNSTIAVALDTEGKLFLRDRIKVRNLDEFIPMCEGAMLSEKEQGTVWGFEDVAFQKLVIKQFIRKPQLVNKKMLRVKPMGDKVERARPWQLRAKDKKVILVRGSWNNDFIREASAFPRGRHDDDVDTVSGGVQMIAQATVVRKQATSYQG